MSVAVEVSTAAPVAPPAPRMAADEAALWQRWTVDHDGTAREALIERHARFARLVARDVFLRLRLPMADWNDYVQYATVGLIEALDRFDPLRGVDFTTFARHRVRGAVFNGLRNFHEVGQRADRESHRHAERASSLAEDGGDDALTEIVSVSIGLAMGFLLDLESLPTPEVEGCDAYRAVALEQLRRRLIDCVQRIPERERRIVTLHYYQHMSFIEIAQLMGVTKGRISQLHKRALSLLREAYERG